MITSQEKAEIIAEFGKEFGKGDTDSGCSAVQVAILTKRINNLKPHFQKHIHDFHSNRGLMKLIGRRRSLLRYVQRKNADQYGALIKKLGLRK